MIIKRVSPVTKKTNEKDLNVTPEQIGRWMAGAFAQDVFPQLTAVEREFIISGCTAEDWEALFGKPEDDQ